MATPPPYTSGAIEKRVLGIVAELVDELRGAAPPGHVAPGDLLERDLGISSLERVELLVRLERVFDVRLSDAAMADAETPLDLVHAIQRAEPSVIEHLPAVQPRAPGDTRVATPAPPSVCTVVEALAWHAERTPDRIHIHLRENDEQETTLTYGRLWQQARAVASGLLARGLGHHDTVAIVLRTELAFFPSFFGTLLAGCVPVPLYPPFRANRIEEYALRQVEIIRNAGARLMITFAEVERVAGLLVNQAPSLKTIVRMDALAGETAGRQQRRSKADDPALIQYTSGSTGHPKGVLLSHANLLANIRAIQQGLAIGSNDVGVSWLPLYHDMGLIGAWLGTLYCGIPLALMSPLAFLARPARWLWALHGHRGTLSPAPNFAFDLCTHRITDAELKGLDLSSVRVLLNGAEAVSPDALERFTKRFASYGLRAEALAPVYGLAECGVGLALPPLGRRPRIDRVDRVAFEKTGRAIPAVADAVSVRRFVSCGCALPGHKLQVVDEAGTALAERREGRVRFRGPSATGGYYRNPEATRELIGTDGWLETGDLGYIAGGEVFVTGRRKDLIIKGGRNLHPQEAEEIVSDVQGVRKGCVAAFGIPDPDLGTERFVIVAETRVANAVNRQQIQSAVIARLVDVVGLPPDVVVLSPPGSVLKTSSGKIRRSATRAAYLAGRLTRGRSSAAAQWARLAGRASLARFGRWTTRSLFAVFTTYVVTMFVTTGLVVWGLMAIWPSGPRIDRLVGRWTRLLFALTGCRIDVHGLDHLHELGPAVLVANHASYLDPVLMLSVLPVSVRFAAKRQLTRYPFIGMAIRKRGHITIENADLSQRIEGAHDIRAPLAAAESLFVFPEGTFVAAPGLLPFRLGAFRAAAESGCPVVPITIRGTRHIFPADTWLLQPGRITVTIGKPILATGQSWLEIVRMRDEARAVIARGTGEDE